MIHELRCYHAIPGRKCDLLKRFNDGTFDLFARHGFKVVSFWDRPGTDELWYVLEWSDEESMTRSWEAFKSDASWAMLKSASETNGPLIGTVDSIVLSPMTASAPTRNDRGMT
jgi:hypothetical protein